MGAASSWYADIADLRFGNGSAALPPRSATGGSPRLTGAVSAGPASRSVRWLGRRQLSEAAVCGKAQPQTRRQDDGRDQGNDRHRHPTSTPPEARMTGNARGVDEDGHDEEES